MRVNNKIREFVSEYKEPSTEYYVIVASDDNDSALVGFLVSRSFVITGENLKEAERFDSYEDCMKTIRGFSDMYNFEIYRVIDGGRTLSVIQWPKL